MEGRRKSRQPAARWIDSVVALNKDLKDQAGDRSSIRSSIYMVAEN